MNTQNNSIVITNRTNKFVLVPRPNIPPRGMQAGLISEVSNVTGTEKGAEFSRMDIVVKLDAKDQSGENYRLTKSYRISGTGHGIAAFLADYNAMSGSELTKADLYDFDPQSMVNSHAIAEVAYIDGPKGMVAKIKAFHPLKEIEQMAAV